MKLNFEIIKQDLLQKFTTNKGTIYDNSQLVIFLEWEGKLGLGTGLFSNSMNRNILEEVRIVSIMPSIEKFIAQKDPFDSRVIMETVKIEFKDDPILHSALDMALLDLQGKVAGLSLKSILGHRHSSLPQSGFSLGAMDNAELLERVKNYQNYPILKFKFTTNTDVGIIREIRNIYSGRIWVDGNGAWTLEEAIKAAKLFTDYNVELLEQPLKRGNYLQNEKLRTNSSLKLIADEDCCCHEDLLRISKYFDGVAIKNFKCFQLSLCIELCIMAPKLGLDIMLGCRTENIIGITATAQLSGFAQYLDLDGHVDLQEERFHGLLFNCGNVVLPPGHGIGVIDEQKK